MTDKKKLLPETPEAATSDPHFDMRCCFATATARGAAVPQTQDEAETAKFARLDSMGAL
jgi:hypothetical protein